MVYKFFCLLLPFFKDRTGKPAEPFYFSQDHLSRAAKSCAGVFFYRAEPANPRRKAYLNPIKQAERLAQYRVKGHCPLRVQGGARRSLPQGNLRRQAKPELKKQAGTACANPGQGTLSLAGAGRSPQIYCRKAIPADRRTPTPIKQVVRLALPPTGGNTA